MKDKYIGDVLRNTLRHTHDLGIFEMVRIKGTDQETLIDTVDGEKSVIVKGRMKQPVSEFTDATVGLARMDMLSGFLKLDSFGSEHSTVQVIANDAGPQEVVFEGDDGNRSVYRFTGEAVVNQVLGNLNFKGAKWDLTFSPTKQATKTLRNFAAVMGNYENKFSPKAKDGKLVFNLGEGQNDRSTVVMSTQADGDFAADWSWPIDIVLKILTLGSDAVCNISFSSAGIMQIVVDNGVSEFTYLLPGG